MIKFNRAGHQKRKIKHAKMEKTYVFGLMLVFGLMWGID